MLPALNTSFPVASLSRARGKGGIDKYRRHTQSHTHTDTQTHRVLQLCGPVAVLDDGVLAVADAQHTDRLSGASLRAHLHRVGPHPIRQPSRTLTPLHGQRGACTARVHTHTHTHIHTHTHTHTRTHTHTHTVARRAGQPLHHHRHRQGPGRAGRRSVRACARARARVCVPARV